jgi:hypothetical protein
MDPDPPLPFLPTPDQLLLLQACLASPEAAAPAWMRWRDRVDPARLDAASARLLPMLGASLKAAGVGDAALAPYIEARRRASDRNHLIAYKAGKAVAALAAAGIPTLALKGAALAWRYYGDPSLRPMADLDLMVPRGEALRAFRVLAGSGFGPGGEPMPRGAGMLAIRHAAAVDDGRPGGAIDLHWRSHYAYVSEAADAAMWRGATPLTIGKASTLAPNPADLLIGVCVHGARWSALPAIRWVADSLVLMRRAPIDWPYLVTQTRRLRASAPMLAALGYLAAVFGAPTADVVAALSERQPARSERLLFGAEQAPPGRRSLSVALRLHIRLAALTSPGLDGAVRYATALWGRRTPRQALRWAGRRLRAGDRVRQAG